MSENINWDEATSASGYVMLKPDVEKKLVLKNWTLEKKPADAKVAAGEICFVADVVEEDGSPCDGVKFETTSKRLKKKLRPIFENKTDGDQVKVSILRVGEQFNTQYSVRELTE